MNQEQVIFLIASPRSGSTLAQRMIGSHTRIHTHPEPHLITPLYYLGYYDTVQKAPFDHINSGQAIRELVEDLPHQENDYLDALRAYTQTLYSRLLEPTTADHFLDKTPAYALIVDFLIKLYPRAKYVVLTRHPLAIHHSVAHSFFGGDYQEAVNTNPILERYIPAIGDFLESAPVPFFHMRYEELVQEPHGTMQQLADYLGLPFEKDMVTYGNQKHISKSFGDPITVHKHQAPVTTSLEKWAADLAARPDELRRAQGIINQLDPDHLKAWGYPKDTLYDALGATQTKATKVSGLQTYRLKKKALAGLRRNIQGNSAGRAVQKIRYYCDLLLKESQ